MLPQHMLLGDETFIVHSDLRLDNLIFHREGPRMPATLEWEFSMLGLPLASFFNHAPTRRWRPNQFRRMAEHDLGTLGISRRPLCS
jgi:aminoglycoside phosphotransferase (APT) family kinase protein